MAGEALPAPVRASSNDMRADEPSGRHSVGAVCGVPFRALSALLHRGQPAGGPAHGVLGVTGRAGRAGADAVWVGAAGAGADGMGGGCHFGHRARHVRAARCNCGAAGYAGLGTGRICVGAGVAVPLADPAAAARSSADGNGVAVTYRDGPAGRADVARCAADCYSGRRILGAGPGRRLCAVVMGGSSGERSVADAGHGAACRVHGHVLRSDTVWNDHPSGAGDGPARV